MASRDVIEFRSRYATPLGLDLPGDLAFEEWHEIGLALGHAGKSFQWMLGDWWHHGQHRYGERKEMLDQCGLSFQACADCAWVAAKFETSRRREVLSFEHHRMVAALPPEDADELLDWCTCNGTACRSTRELRSEMRRRVLGSPKAEPAKFAAGSGMASLAERADTQGCSPPTIKPSGPAPPAPVDESARINRQAVLGFATVLHQQVPEMLEYLVKFLGDERRQIALLPLAKRVALARGYLRSLEVTPDDLRA